MKTMNHLTITIIALGALFATISSLSQGAGGSQSADLAFPTTDMQKIMLAAQNSTPFMEKVGRYDHYLLARATMGPGGEKAGNATSEEYDLVYALYINRGYCYFDHLLDVRLDSNLDVTNATEYSIKDEPPGYPRPPVSCLSNAGPPTVDYDRLLTILPPSPFAAVNETFNAISDTVVFSGTIHKMYSRYLLIEVFSPSGQRVATSQPMPEPDGTYSQAFHPYSPLWATPGNYLVSITSGPHSLVESRFYFKGVGCCFSEAPVYYTYRGMPPLEQWKEMYPLKDTACTKGTQLVFKAEDGSPACVRPDTAQVLIERGWTKENTSNASTGLSNTGTTPPVGLEIESANQTYEAGYPVDLRVNFTARPPHCKLPSFVVRDTQDGSVVFGPYPGWNYTSSNCTDYLPFSFYAGLENNTLVTRDTNYSLEAEIYGKRYEKMISVIPSEYSGKNITAESGSVLPGLATDFECPALQGSMSADTILNSSGFDGVYHRYYIRISHSEEVDDYFLKPGHNGTIILKVYRGSAFPRDANLAGGLGFFNSQSSSGNFGHGGVTASYSPNPAVAGPDGYATFDLTLSAARDASHGTYWVFLPPGGCSGGMPIFLTVGDGPLAQPPDLLGYDLSVDFSFSESPVLTVGVSNVSIHTFDNCSLAYMAGNKTTILDRFDAIPPGFSYKYHFSSNPPKGDRVVFGCSNPHVTKVYPSS